MSNKFIAQQSSVRRGSICMIYGDILSENNGLTCVVYRVYFDEGEWWADAFDYFDKPKFSILEDENLIKLDYIALPVSILMSIGDTELEDVK